MVLAEGKPNDASPDPVVMQMVAENLRLLDFVQTGQPIEQQALLLTPSDDMTEHETASETQEHEVLRAIDTLNCLRQQAEGTMVYTYHHPDSEDRDSFWTIPSRGLFVTERYHIDNGVIRRVSGTVSPTPPTRYTKFLNVVKATKGNMEAESPATDTAPGSRQRRWGSAVLDFIIQPMRQPPKRVRK